MGVVERCVDHVGREAQEPGSEPVVVAVLDHPQVGRGGEHEARPIGERLGAQGSPRPDARVACVTQERDPGRARAAVPGEPTELRGEEDEEVAVRRGEARPRRVVARVAGSHAERIRHELGEVAGPPAVEDPDEGSRQEAVGRVVEVETRAREEDLGQRPRVEREGDLRGDGLAALTGAVGRTCGRNEPRQRRGRPSDHAGRQVQPAGRLERPVDPKARQPCLQLADRRWPDLGSRQDVGQRVEVVAHADASLRARLEGRRAAPAERVQDDVARPRVARDERVGEGRREAGQVRAHRVVGVAPQSRLALPVGLERQLGERGERQAELARNGTSSTRGTVEASGRAG